MGLAHRIIPTVLCRGRVQVKGKAFNAWRSVGLVEQSVRIHQARGVDELMLLDIGATPEGRGPDLKLIEELTEKCFMPLTVGGGVRTVQHVKDLLRAGADCVVIRSGGYDLVRRAADIVGSQAIVAAMDVNGLSYYRGWDNVAKDWAAAGAGEILLTRMEREGEMCGYDLDLVKLVRDAVTIPVVAHGGCGTPQHMLEAIQAGASAVAAGAMFQFTDTTPKDAAAYLHANGIEVRI